MKKEKNIKFIKAFLLSCLLVFSFNLASDAKAALVPCGLDGTANCTLCHLILGFKNIYDYLLALLLAATTLVIVVAGVMYMVSSGAKGMIEKAKSALTYALTAMILGLLAWLIINTVLNALGYNKSGSWWTFTCDTTQTVGPTTMGSGGATLPGTTPGGGATGNATGSGGRPSGTGLVTNGQKTLAQVAADLKAVTVYDSGRQGWMSDGTFHGDCSSWAQEFYKVAYGIDPGATTADMIKNANGNPDRSDLPIGSLLVVRGSGNHAIIYLGDDSVVANSTEGVNVKYGKLSGYKTTYAVIKPPSA